MDQTGTTPSLVSFPSHPWSFDSFYVFSILGAEKLALRGNAEDRELNSYANWRHVSTELTTHEYPLLREGSLLE